LEILSRAAMRNFNKVRLVGEGINEIVDGIQAFDKADELGLDLVLVSDETQPPVVRIQDFRKIEYEKKKAKKQQKQTKKIELKEVRFMANISDHDFETKAKRIQSFLEKGHKVKISVRLKGRERDTPERARAIIDRVEKAVPCKLSRVPGPMATAILEPSK